uniref:Uncharacterized protein n=1 Tax=Haptolina ericina TaxID=156174 RepID=A0A7S3ARZ5_9EUKA
MAVWSRMEIQDIYMWPTWEAEVFEILNGDTFKELRKIFLAYTRSISEDSAADALEMSMDEFHDFVVDVGLETKKYKFDVMCNQFIKANATNTAAVREAHKQGRRDAESHGNDEEEFRKVAVARVRGSDDGREVKKDQELVLYEFLNMMVRIAFWRSNPSFGLFGNKDEPVAVPLALRTMLNDIVMPNAKRENSAEFRDNEMKDPAVLAVLDEYKPKLLAWYKKKTSDDSEEQHMSDKLGFDEWLRVLDRQDLVGVWEVEQLSEITGDKSCQGNIRVRLSHAMCKAAFMDSQGIDQLSGAQAAEGGTADQVTNEMTVLDFDEFLECLCRCGCSKYSSVKVMKPAAKVKGFLENFLDEKEVQQVVQESTYIRATRFDAVNESMPLDGQEPAAHQHWLGEWKQIELSGLYAFPTWEKEVHDILQKNYHDLASIFRAYAKSLKDVSPDAKATGATLMDIEEFNDFVVDVGLETKHYKLEQMAEQFDVADKAANKGIAGPKANMQLTIPEFMNVLCRVAFWRLNPEFGELTAELDLELTPVPHALTIALKEVVLPNALRDDAVSFRQDVYALPAVQEVIGTYKDRLREWFGALPDVATSGNKVTMKTWVQTMSTLGQVGTFSCVQESDVTGDERAGMIYKCRLSLPQVQAEFIESQQDFSKISQGGLTTDNTTLDFDEMLECIARCGVDKYRAIKAISTVGAIEGMCRNILGDAHEEQIMNKALYIHAPRFVPSGDGDEDWVACWNKVKVDKVPGFPLWEEAVHNELQGVWQEIKSVFRAYSAGSDGPGDTMDFAEFEDFILEADLPTKTYGFQAISGQFTQANKGSKDHVLEIDEFVSMLISIAFFRANPNYGLKGTSSAASGTANLDTDFDGVADSGTPLPGALTECLEVMLKSTRRDDAAKFVDEVMLAPDVAEILKRNEEVLFVVWEDLSEGRDFMTLEEWLAVLDERALFGECTIDHDGQILKARFTEPQAKAAFLQSVSDKSAGLSQQDFIECLSRCGVAKYRGVPFLSAPDVIAGFIQNLVGEADEEEVIRGAKPSLPDGFKSGFKEKAGARITEKVKAAEDIDEE